MKSTVAMVLAIIGIILNILGLLRIGEAVQASNTLLVLNHAALSAHLTATAACFYIGTGALILSVIVALSRKNLIVGLVLTVLLCGCSAQKPVKINSCTWNGGTCIHSTAHVHVAPRGRR